MEVSTYIDKRVVLRCKNNLSYAGLFRGVETLDGMRPSAVVELDPASGFAILCPIDFVAEVRVVPITEAEQQWT